SLHFGLMNTGYFSSGMLSSFTPYENIAPKYRKKITPDAYFSLKLAKVLKDADEVVVISHHRRLTTQLIGLSKIYSKSIKLIHIAHITLHKYRRFTLFPENTVAVSQKVKSNIENYFQARCKRVIYNGIPNKPASQKTFDPRHIVVSMPAIIESRKQQVVLARFLKNKLPEGMSLQFVGDGPNKKLLEEEVGNDPQFKLLGHVDDMEKRYSTSDFVLLFSKTEGLPLSLIEAQNYGIPIICNDVGGSLEILSPGKNGFLANSLSELLDCLQSLPKMTTANYREMKVASLKNFKEQFQFDKMVNAYLELIKELCQN